MKTSLLPDLLYHLVNSVILTMIVSVFVLWRYRVSVLMGMTGGDQQIVPLPALSARRVEPPAALDVAHRLTWERRCERRLAAAYFLAVLLLALPLALGDFYVQDFQAYYPSRIIMIVLLYSFVSAPMVVTSLSLSPARAATGVVALVAALTMAVIAAEVLEDLILGQRIGRAELAVGPLFLSLLVGQLWLPELFWIVSWPHKLRSVAPLTFSALVLFGLGPFVGSQLTPNSIGEGSLELNTTFLGIALPAGCLGWLRLRQLSAQYERKRFSDAQLLSRTWWFMFMLNVALQFFDSKHQWAAAGLCVFGVVCFAPVSSWAVSRLRPDPLVNDGRTLLMLRAFGHTARTERLFDRIGARWRIFGPVFLIAAPDVTARTIGPGEYLRWLTGRVDEIFVKSARDLVERLARLDLAPDPDGRYRVNAFCCRSNTWQATVVELIGRSDAVVMDVRGLTPMTHGCEFELQQLALRMHPHRIVLVADHKTDRDLLIAALGPHAAETRVVTVRGRNVSPVFDALLAAAG